MRILLENNGDINASTDAGRTPLMYAVEMDHEPLVTWLASQSAKFNLRLDATDAEGATALILAIEKQTEIGAAMAKSLLINGADPNVITLRRKTALKIACQAQNVEQVNMLLDHHVIRRKSAFNLLKDEAAKTIETRLSEDEKKLQQEAERMQKEAEIQEKLTMQSKSGVFHRNPFESWVEYRDKKTKKPFYYNTVTRKSTFDKPREFKPDKNRLIKDATFGMSFYH